MRRPEARASPPSNSGKFFQFVETRAWIGSERVSANRGHGATHGHSSPSHQKDASTHRCRRCCFMVSFLTATLNIPVHYSTIRLVVCFENRTDEGIDDPNCCTDHNTSQPGLTCFSPPQPTKFTNAPSVKQELGPTITCSDFPYHPLSRHKTKTCKVQF